MKLALTILLAGLLGCATFERNANSAMGAMDIAVTLAQTAWHRYVSTGRPSAAEIEKVKQYFASYQIAKTAFASAMQAYHDSQSKDPNDVNMMLNNLNYAAIAVVDLVVLWISPEEKPAVHKAQKQMLENMPHRYTRH
jgi:hypothetical protein